MTPNVFAVALLLFFCLIASFSATAASANDNTKHFTHKDKHKYCIIGGGPGGIQLAYFFHRYGLDYAVFERNSRPGSFFEKYPRQRKLISINKVYTGTNDTEFNLRHDWNSLLNGDVDFFFPPASSSTEQQQQREEMFLFKEISKEYYPDAGTIPVYLERFLEKHPLNIVFNVEVDRVLRQNRVPSDHSEPIVNGGGPFHLLLSTGQSVECTAAVILATGKTTEKELTVREGKELVTSYTDAPTDPEEYNGQEILIIGGGNSAFELAKAIEGNTALLHIASRNPIQLAYQSHYVGDVRAVNLGFLDRYQLKSNDALIATPSKDIRNERLVRDNATGRIKLLPVDLDPELLRMVQEEQRRGDPNGGGDNSNNQQQQGKKSPEQEAHERMQNEAAEELYPCRRGYHRVISCMGFKFSSSPFFNATPTKRTQKAFAAIERRITTRSDAQDALAAVSPAVDPGNSYLEIASNFESVNVPDLFVVGALAHFRDFKRSAGGFIHGFRYTARTLAAMLRERYEHDDQDPAKYEYPFIPCYTKADVLRRFLFRLKNVSSLYQMQSQLADVVLINEDRNKDDKQPRFLYYQDLPLDNVRSKVPQLVSINRMRGTSLRFLTLSLEFGQGFQGVGTLHHQAQKETYRRKAEKMMWDPSVPMADPDVRLYVAQRLNPFRPLPMQEKITAQGLMVRDDKELRKYENVSTDLANLLHPLEDPPTMLPPQNGRPPRLNRFLFLHPVVREYKRSSPQQQQVVAQQGQAGTSSSSSNNAIPMVRNQLVREVRLHEDVLNDFTGYHYAVVPLRNFLDKALK